MGGAIKKLFGLCLGLVTGAVACLYAGNQAAAVAPPHAQADDLSRHFAGDPGDGWTLLGGFLIVVALALLSACVMLWWRERRAQV